MGQLSADSLLTERLYDGNAKKCHLCHLCNVAQLSSKRTGGNGFQVETENEKFAVVLTYSTKS